VVTQLDSAIGELDLIDDLLTDYAKKLDVRFVIDKLNYIEIFYYLIIIYIYILNNNFIYTYIRIWDMTSNKLKIKTKIFKYKLKIKNYYIKNYQIYW